MPLQEVDRLTVNVSALVFGTVETIHFGIGAARTSRKPKSISGSVMVVKGSRTSTVTDGVVQATVGIKAIHVLLVTKLLVRVIDWVILMLRGRQQPFLSRV